MDMSVCGQIYLVCVILSASLLTVLCGEGCVFRRVTTGLNTGHLKCYTFSQHYDDREMLDSSCVLKCSQIELCYYSIGQDGNCILCMNYAFTGLKRKPLPPTTYHTVYEKLPRPALAIYMDRNGLDYHPDHKDANCSSFRLSVMSRGQVLDTLVTCIPVCDCGWIAEDYAITFTECSRRNCDHLHDVKWCTSQRVPKGLYCAYTAS